MKLLRLLRKFSSIHHEPPYEWIMDGDMNGEDIFRFIKALLHNDPPLYQSRHGAFETREDKALLT